MIDERLRTLLERKARELRNEFEEAYCWKPDRSLELNLAGCEQAMRNPKHSEGFRRRTLVRIDVIKTEQARRARK